jgi:predicted cobalt transporter CbtA
MKVIPLVVGVILIVAGLAEFITSIPSISNGSFWGAGGFSLGLAFGFLVGLGLVSYAFVGGRTSPAEVDAVSSR